MKVENFFSWALNQRLVPRTKTAQEAQFEFYSQFTNLHSARSGFRDNQQVSYADFEEWHAVANTQIERDADFRNMV